MEKLNQKNRQAYESYSQLYSVKYFNNWISLQVGNKGFLRWSQRVEEKVRDYIEGSDLLLH